MAKIAVVLVRGMIGMSQGIRDTLKMLNLNRKNHCVVLENTPSACGMVGKVKDFVTWGEIDEETEKSLQQRMSGKVARLQPPRRGFGRKGIKAPFSIGGALGYRGAKMKDLIQRMI